MGLESLHPGGDAERLVSSWCFSHLPWQEKSEAMRSKIIEEEKRKGVEREGGREGGQDLARPSAELDQSISADGRAGSAKRPARPSVELNQSSSADGRAGSITRPARHPPIWISPVRRMAELDRTRDKLGRPCSSPLRD
ncbi:hypothetical protein DY000_02059920 [Brassica cretica]|uniref:Uncharacterized protein n=1 Tax=Brassica cretica TaxID=69181 RepID=A0ABQ7B0F5_BRACR|nr:hypothetical protein DY000_02059920 [Brassica cretica]